MRGLPQFQSVKKRLFQRCGGVELTPQIYGTGFRPAEPLSDHYAALQSDVLLSSIVLLKSIPYVSIDQIE